MNDREQLEMAAKAASVPAEWWSGLGMWIGDPPAGKPWNPLKDDGDALRLAVKLRMDIAHFEQSVRADVTGFDDCHELNGDDASAATRRAIVRAAAEIGKAMP